MSEAAPQNHFAQGENIQGPDYAALVSGGLQKCQEYGFDVAGSLAAGVGSEAVTADIEAQAGEVVNLAASIAGDMELDQKFFDRPAHTVMLVSIAESWLKNEKAAQNPDGERARIIAERESLVDIASMFAGNKSAAVTDISSSDPHSRHRYIEGLVTREDKERDEYIESLVDKGLSDEVQQILKQTGRGTFLEEQRAALGLDGKKEQPFTVKVLSAAESVDVYVSHVQPEIKYPDWDWDYKAHSEDENIAHRAEVDAATAQTEANNAETDVLIKAMDRYRELYGERYGELPPAFVTLKEGEDPVLYLRAPQAMALVKYFNNDPMPSDSDKAKDIEGIFAIIQHEFGHTQKNMTLGVHNQLGLNIEERKAELISGDKQGYQDVKSLFTDLSFATGVSMTKEVLAGALKEEDSLSAFLAVTAQKIGMRNAMLMMALKPLPYEKYPEQAKDFVDLSKQRKPSDVSTLEIPVRETLEALGHQKMDAAVENWMRELQDRKGELGDFEEHSYPAYRRTHGFGISSDKIADAVRKIRAEKTAG